MIKLIGLNFVVLIVDLMFWNVFDFCQLFSHGLEFLI